MSKHFTINPKLDLVLERFIDAPKHLVWEALTKSEHLKEWYMPKPWGVVANCELDVRPGGIFSIDIASAEGQEFPNLGCFLEVVPMERLSWTSMLFPAIVRQFLRHSDHCHRHDGNRGNRNSLRLHGAAPGRS